MFDRLCVRFKYRPEFWKEYLKFCLQIGSRKNFYRAFSNSIRFNSSSLVIWLIAIYYELEFNSNPFKARQLFIKAIKMNTRMQDMWVEYFRFECKFIKLIEKREEYLEGGAAPVEDEMEIEQDDGFLAFGGDDGPSSRSLPDALVRDLLESSDEEGPTKEERLDLEKKKSNHGLLLVILESIKDNFGDKIDFKLYQRLIGVLREEKQGSQEIRLAILKVSELVMADEDLSLEERTILDFTTRGIFDLIDFSEEENKKKLEKKVMKAIDETNPKNLALVALSHASLETIKEVNHNKIILKAISHSMKSDLTIESIILTLKNFDVKVTEKCREVLEAHKFEERTLEIYLKKGIEIPSNYQRVKYLEDFMKKANEKTQSSLSALQKVELSKRIISIVVDYLREKDFSEEDDQGKYKYIAQYLKILISMTKLNVEVMDHLAKCVIEKWIQSHPGDSRLVNTVAESFWALKKQCPARMFGFILEQSSSVNSFKTSSTKPLTSISLCSATPKTFLSGS